MTAFSVIIDRKVWKKWGNIMKSIQSKMICFILIGIIVSTTMIGGIGIKSAKSVVDSDSVQIMNLTCSEKAQELNTLLARIEQSVEILSVITTDGLEDIETLKNDQEFCKNYSNEIKNAGLTIANATDGAVAVWVRFDPNITTDVVFFLVKNMTTGTFEDYEMTDIFKYSKDDVEHVGWYYEPQKAKQAIWMQPYYNKNIDIYMISYIIPVYRNGKFLGVVGMDIDFNYITNQSDSIKVYQTGTGFLVDESFNLVHGKKLKQNKLKDEFKQSLLSKKQGILTDKDEVYEYSLFGVKKKVAFRSLKNGMVLGVTAPVSEIDSTKDKLIKKIIVITLLIALVFLFMAWVNAKTIVLPLKKLDVAAREIAKGNLDASLDCKSKDEVGSLSKSLKEMVSQLKLRIQYMNELAYFDTLTNVKNNTAYLQEVTFLKKEMDTGAVDFTLFVVDVNGLKEINDHYGHDYGNKLIISAANAMIQIFGYENVFRIGGDEFAVIMKNISSTKGSELQQKFIKLVQNAEGEIKLSAAIGGAAFHPTVDSDYEGVFKRADANMYEMKERMKAQGETSRIRKM